MKLLFPMRKRYLFAIFYLIPFLLLGMEEIRFEHIDNKNGLSHNTVRYITQDSRGLIWIASMNGLDRYDGHKFISIYPEFSPLSLSENNIRKMEEDGHGLMWVQTSSRFINCYDLRRETFVDYTGTNEARQYRRMKVMSNGDVWLWGTEHGLCHVRHHEGGISSLLYDKENIGTNVIAFVLEDSSGKIWVGTNRGLLQIEDNVPKLYDEKLPQYNYHSVFELKDRIYFFTYNCEILVYDKKKKLFLPVIDYSPLNNGFRINETIAVDDDKILITGRQATLMFDVTASRVVSATPFFQGGNIQDAYIRPDNRGDGWVYNKSGNIWHYNKTTRSFEKFRLIPESILSIIDNERYDVFTDSRDITWISTYGNGLFAIEKNGKINHYTTTNSELRTNYLLSVTEDRTGNIWVGTENAGITKISFTEYRNKVYIPDPLRTESWEETIRSAFEDGDGNLWIGTKNGDVYVYDKEWNRKEIFSGRQKGVYSIHSDREGNIWIGTKGDGLRIFSKNGRSGYQDWAYLLSQDKNAGENNIYAILCDTKGRMWIGTFGNGLILGEWEKGQLRTKTFPAISRIQKQVRCLLQDSAGRIWASGENGVVLFDPDKLLQDDDAFDWYYFDKNNPASLNNNIVKTVFEDHQQQIWLGTSGGGLNLAVEDSLSGKFTFRHYSSKNGLTNNVVQSILEDDNHFLWISTESGLSKFNPGEDLFENFNFTNTWNSDYFLESVALKRKTGELLFGNYNGVYIIDPYSFERPSYSEPVILTGFIINGIPVNPNSPESPLKESITQTEKIRLRHNQNSFGLEFSSLNYQDIHSNRYTYILENYDREWNPVTQYNTAIYKNIPPGKYRFKVKCVNNPYTMDSTEAQVEITIIPPFWKSTQALILYLILSVLLAWFTFRTVMKMNRLNNQIVIEKELTEYRLRFFTNISHEFRTPLTLIQGSIDNMNDMQLPPLLKKQVHTLERSSSKLMRLIDQLLEFRKLQNDQMDLRLEYTDGVAFLQGIYDIFVETAERKQIDFTFLSNHKSRILLLDKEKIEKIAFNLLSNAFKHTPEKGKVKMELLFDEENMCFSLKVSDSGIGIPPEKQHLLFIRFKQINYTASGIGIGLHLASELTKAHKGEIVYNASEWGGASFTVTIPMSKDSYEEHQIVQSDIPLLVKPVDIVQDDDISYPETDTSGRKYTILLIEDDEEVRLFLEEQLKKYFTIITAPNGLIGWETAINEEPNLIVCDVMMPEMDGFEVTRKIRSDFQTSHIPLILLTAHSSIEHQLEGINAGADAYIIKPFSTKYLISRIIKLIEQREKLQYKFAHEPGMVQPTITTSDKDAAFIRKIHEVIERHLSNAEFSVDDFAKEVHLGRTIFYKKVKGITNYSPNEYVRIVRLKKATQLLKNTDLNISEVAYEVGFNDPDYFSKCFKEQFGMTPRQFRNEEKEKEV